VASRYRIVFRPDGSVQSHHYAPQIQTSWSLIYTTLRNAFGLEHHHRGYTLNDIRQISPNRVDALFDNGASVEADLLIGADGGGSTVRSLLWANSEPHYAGYVAWRGLLPESAVPEEVRSALLGNFAFANNQGSHILGYLVPGEHNDVTPGRRLYNWVWYRTVSAQTLPALLIDRYGQKRSYSVPEGLLSDTWIRELHIQANTLLPPPFQAVVKATEQPFMQVIRDLIVDEMVVKRVILLGDAAAIPRPHTAASTAKAATNALALSDALRASPPDIDQALKGWQVSQVAFARRLHRDGREIGSYLMFNAASVPLDA
jgi:2-polyprenyl-6-methoxyphenol hydroxylase-like FAD-dependent oxidoreductase